MKLFLLFYEGVPDYLPRNDPYVTNGLIARWHVREWTTVVGKLSANPVCPADV